MKRLYILLLICVTAFTISNGQFTKLGGGLGLTTGFPFQNITSDYNKSGNFDVSVKGIIKLSLPINLSPSITYFIPHLSKTVGTFSQTTNNVSALMFDINGHYVVNLLDRFEFYGLAGFDVLYAWKKEIDETGGTAPFTETKREQENGLGLNVGAGTYLKIIKQFDLYAEAKYVIYGKDKLFFSNYNQFMVSAGVLINLQWMKKNDTPGM